MVFGVYSVRDVKTGYLTPTIDANDQSAVRNFEHAVMQQNTLLYSHAEDYSLFKIADFDADTAEVIPCEKRLLVEGAFVKGAL